MIEHFIERILPPIIGILELMGIFVVAFSGLKAFWEYLQNTFKGKHYPCSSIWRPAWPPAWSSRWPPRSSRPCWSGR